MTALCYIRIVTQMRLIVGLRLFRRVTHNQRIAFASGIVIAHVVRRIVILGVMRITETVLFIRYSEPVKTFFLA